ncbi:c-type cytochrome domain-containing protein [Shumkonia mesophila]|uniref:c-type cytochrome domain-containing protein n=1 Tax=Shumkonia mesophila TaxID=2838854 RepID=UPI0029345D79|nr:c-type cytochrome domain-containing protein [Shumkonia mesophila]
MFTRMRRLSWAAGATAAAVLAMAAAAAVAEEPISFKEDVAPIIQIRCLECHQPGGDGFVQSGLDLSSYAGVMKGTKFGPVVVPGDAMTSNFLVVVDGRASQAIRMPHERKKLTKCEIDILRRWVNSGAKNN